MLGRGGGGDARRGKEDEGAQISLLLSLLTFLGISVLFFPLKFASITVICLNTPGNTHALGS
jgi:hypothetical protein